MATRIDPNFVFQIKKRIGETYSDVLALVSEIERLEAECERLEAINTQLVELVKKIGDEKTQVPVAKSESHYFTCNCRLRDNSYRGTTPGKCNHCGGAV